MQTTPCAGIAHAHCPCAVAVKGGRDVYVINHCDGANFMGFTRSDQQKVLEVVNVADTHIRVIISQLQCF